MYSLRERKDPKGMGLQERELPKRYLNCYAVERTRYLRGRSKKCREKKEKKKDCSREDRGPGNVA